MTDEATEVRALLASLVRDHEALVAATEGSNVDDEHDPEGSTIAFERSQLAASIERTRARLVEIDESERRRADGTYGVCEVCGGPIGAGRLEARPHTRVCIDHA